MYICFCYIPPSNLSSPEESQETFNNLQSEIAKFSRMGKTLLMGDFNSRMGKLQEKYIIDVTESDFHTSKTIDNNIISPSVRNSCDRTVNDNGKHFYDIINNSHLALINGRTIGDFKGEFTCDKWNGSSSVDLCLINYEYLKDIISFSVLPPTTYSDHRPISVRIKAKTLPIILDDNNLTVIKKFIWDEMGRNRFKSILQRNDFLNRIKDFENHKYTDPDVALSILSGIFHDAAKLSLKTKKIEFPEKINSSNTVKNPVLLALKIQFKRARHLSLKKNPTLIEDKSFLQLKRNTEKWLNKLIIVSKKTKY